jgi:hypothetical protein
MKHPKALREAVRRAYESGASYTRLSSQFRIARETARHWATAGRWERETAPVVVAAGGPQPRDRQGRFVDSPPDPDEVRARRKGRRTKRPAEPPPDSAALLESLRRTIARAVAEAEERWAGAGTVPPDDKDLRALGAIATVLARVVALETPTRTDRDGRDDPDPDPDGDSAAIDFDDPRQREAFALRLEQLAGGAAARRAGEPEAA